MWNKPASAMGNCSTNTDGMDPIRTPVAMSTAKLDEYFASEITKSTIKRARCLFGSLTVQVPLLANSNQISDAVKKRLRRLQLKLEFDFIQFSKSDRIVRILFDSVDVYLDKFFEDHVTLEMVKLHVSMGSNICIYAVSSFGVDVFARALSRRMLELKLDLNCGSFARGNGMVLKIYLGDPADTPIRLTRRLGHPSSSSLIPDLVRASW